MSQLHQWNERIAGASLNAKIVAIKNDQVKVSLEIDEISGHNPGKLCFSLIQQFIHHKMEVDGIVCLRLVIV